MKSSSGGAARAEGAAGREIALADQLAAAEQLAGLGTWCWTRGSPVLVCSTGLAHLLGLGEATAIPVRSILARMQRDQRRVLFNAMRAGAGGSVEVGVADSRTNSRAVFAVLLNADAEGFWGVVHDVTALRKVSADLDLSESRWEIALESAGQAVWDSNLVSGEVYHSRAWRVLRGLRPDGDVADTHENWISRVHPDDIDRIQATISKEHTGEVRSVAFEYRERKADGTYMWVSSLGKPIEWDINGLPTRIVGTDTDITRRKLDEAAMERLKRRLELALEVSKLGIFEANLETRAVHWDKRVREIYGVAEDFDIPADYWEHALHPDDYVTAMKRVWNAVEGKSPYNSDFRVVRPDRTVRHVHTEGTWYRDVDGVEKILGVNWDVTAEVTAKLELERARTLAEARNVELEATKARIEHNAMHDALTGLPNRRYLDLRLAELAKYTSEVGGAVSLLHLDLDLFKQINDTLGHVAGDAMLVHVAKLLREAAGPEAFVARVGGDEFSIVCPVAGGSGQLTALAEDIIARVRRPVPYQGHVCRFGASIGIASRAGKDLDPERLLIDADMALYRAKGRGKNRFEFFTEALQAETLRTKRVADEILMGIEQNQFFPYFQPLFDAQSNELVGVEALARWQHPERGILPP